MTENPRLAAPDATPNDLPLLLALLSSPTVSAPEAARLAGVPLPEVAVAEGGDEDEESSRWEEVAA